MKVIIPGEIKDYEPRLFGNITKRQMITFAVGISIGLLEILILKNFLTFSSLTFFVLFSIIPVGYVGVIKKNGLPMEKYLRIVYRGKFGTNKLVYQTNMFQKITELSKIHPEANILFDEERMTRFDILSGHLLDQTDPLQHYMNSKNNFNLFQDDSVAFKGYINKSIETPKYKQYIAAKYKKGKPQENMEIKVGDLFG